MIILIFFTKSSCIKVEHKPYHSTIDVNSDISKDSSCLHPDYSLLTRYTTGGKSVNGYFLEIDIKNTRLRGASGYSSGRLDLVVDANHTLDLAWQ